MRRRLPPRALAMGLLALALACGCAEEPAPGSPAAAGPGLVVEGIEPAVEPAFRRVVLVTIDTLRADHLASYGWFRSTAPFLDALAERGVLFERAMSASSHTAPSHASMFTGLVPGLHGLATNGSRLGPEVATMAQVFRDAGYRTAAFTSVEFLAGAATGFEHVRARTAVATGVTNAAVSWLRREAKGDPLLLWVHYYEPHRWKDAERAPEEHAEAVRRATTLDAAAAYGAVAALHGLPSEFPAEGLDWRSGDRGDEDVAPRSAAEVLEYVDSYDAQIAYADAEVRRLHEAVAELEAAQGGASLWIVTSDHGEGLGSHGYAGHGWQIYQEQLHVPLIVHATDGSFPARRVSALVSLTDLFPTAVELLGGRLSGPLAERAGRSLLDLLEGGSAFEERPVFAQRRPLRATGGDGVYALQSLSSKYLLRTTGEDEVYDLARDPLELEPTPGDETSPLRAELEEWLRVIAERGGAAETGDEAWLEELRKLGYAE